MTLLVSMAQIFDVWVIGMLNHFRAIDPCLERIVDMGFSPPKDSQHISLEDEKNSYLNAQASNVLFDALSNVVIFQLMPFRDAHELWTSRQIWRVQDLWGWLFSLHLRSYCLLNFFYSTYMWFATR